MRRFFSIASLATLLLGLCLLGREILFQGRVFSGPDLVNYFIPTSDFARGWLRQGVVPLWNPMTFCGWPLVGDAQLRWMYPPNWLLLVLEPAVAFSLLVLAHIGFGALGMWVYLRRVTHVGPWAATCGAASFGLAGFFANHLMSGIVVFPAAGAWAPWILLLGWRLGAPGESPRTVALFAACLGAQILAGAPQIVFYTCLVVLFQGLWRAATVVLQAWREPSAATRPYRSALGILASYAVGAAIAMSIGAASILPTSEFGRLSFQRGEKPAWETVTDCSVAPRYLWLTVAPRFFNNPHVEATYWGGQDGYWDICAYAGLGPIAALLFLLFSGTWLFRSRDVGTPGGDAKQTGPPGIVPFHLVLAGLALLLAMGRYSPSPLVQLFRLLYEWVPGFDRFRVPGRWLLFWEFGVAVLFGLVLDRLFARDGESELQPRLGLIGPLILAVALALCAANSADVMRASGIERFVPDFNASRGHPIYLQWQASAAGSLRRGALFALAWLVVLGAGTMRGGVWRKAVPPIAAALVLVDVFGYGTSVGTTRTRQGQVEEFFAQSPLMKFLAEHLDGHRQLARGDVHDWLVDQNQPELWANRATVHGVRDARGYYPLCLRWFGRFANRLNERPSTHPLGALLQPVGPKPMVETPINPDLLAMLDVKFLLTYRTLRVEGLRLVQRTSFGLGIYEVINRRGPAWLAASRSTEGLSEEQEIALLTASDFDGRREALAANGPPSDFEAAAGDQPGTVSVTRLSPNRIEILVERGMDDLLVVSEAYHPGWRATIDDEPTTAVRTNHALLGAYIPPGRHRIEFRFQPKSFRVGLYTVCVAWLLLAAIVTAGAGRRKATSP